MKKKEVSVSYSDKFRDRLREDLSAKVKYYKPSIMEFVPGFVFEYYEPVDNEGWIEEIFTESTDLDEIKDMLKEGAYRPIRVLKK